MTPALRSMPTVTATWSPIRKAWLIALPNGCELSARDQFDVEQLIAKHASGAAIRYVNPNTR